MKTVLVTGGRGALAQGVARYLGETGTYRVVVGTRDGANGSLRLDVTNVSEVRTALETVAPDFVVHSAATFTNDFDDAYATNVESSRQILEHIKAASLPARILLIGSAAEYGVVRAEDNPINENRALYPVSTYGLTKAWQTQLAGVFHSQGVDVVVARVFNLRGLGLSTRLFVGRISEQIDEILQGRRTKVEVGSLSATRDYLMIDAAAKQIAAILVFGESGQVYHVGSGVPITMRELLTQTLAERHLDSKLIHEKAEHSNRPGYDVPVIYADMTKTMRLVELWESDGKD